VLDDLLACWSGRACSEAEPLDDHQFFQLDAACLLWRLGVAVRRHWTRSTSGAFVVPALAGHLAAPPNSRH
jgi:hypothetical protein